MEKVLKRHGIRRIRAEELQLRLQSPSALLAPGSAVAADAHVRVVAKCLELANEQLAEVRGHLDKLLAGLVSAPSGVAVEEPSGDATGQRPKRPTAD